MVGSDYDYQDLEDNFTLYFGNSGYGRDGSDGRYDEPGSAEYEEEDEEEDRPLGALTTPADPYANTANWLSEEVDEYEPMDNQISE